jgi:GTP-binding protein EngB required for normal cell division
MPTPTHEPARGLNEAQSRHLLSECEYADKLLSEVESILAASSSRSPFPKYAVDLTPAQAKVVRDYIARIRAQLVRVLEGLGVAPAAPRIGAVHAIRTNLAFVDMALEEARPRHMRGYGEVPRSVAPQLEGMVSELQSLVAKLDSYLARGLGNDLQARLEKLEQTSDAIELLKKLERIITERGLVEFRAHLSMILDLLETKSFEIAFFGRVSSGKSSLLNHIVQAGVLPVGVNPITSVPTRLRYGASPGVTVRFAEGKVERCEISRLAEFVTEQHNPANVKHVIWIAVELPSPRLRSGVIFVDTPGLGSLAAAGAAETLAYLPRCDLGVVLVDAGATIAEEDLATVQALYEAAIPASIVLSKADLLNREEQDRAAEYISGQIAARLGVHLPVRPVSVKAGHAHLLDRWFEEEIQPLYGRQQQLAQLSLRRKIGALREAVEAALRIRLERAGRESQRAGSRSRQAEMQLRGAAAELHEARETADRIADALRNLADEGLRKTAVEVAECWRRQGPGRAPVEEVAAACLVRLAAGHAGVLHSALESLAKTLGKALRDAAAELELAGAPADDDLLQALQEMPRPDLGKLELDLRPGLLARFSKRLAVRSAESNLRTQIGSSVARAFQTYAKLLDAWAAKTIREIEARFSAYADAYRAQLERLTAGTDAPSGEQEAILRDLQTLKQQSEEQPEAGPAIRMAPRL